MLTNEEKAKIILEGLDHYLQINHSLEEFYVKGIINGLKEIDRKEFGNQE